MQSFQAMLKKEKPVWCWSKINSLLKTTLNQELITISLKPTVTLDINKDYRKYLKEEPVVDKIIQKFFIDTQKSLQYEQEIGWNWHKSSNLPLISLKIQVKQQISQLSFPVLDGLKASIFAVKMTTEDSVFSLEDIGIRGNSVIDLKDGFGIFNGIRFLSTSYNNEGVKFYLLIVVYNKNQQNDFSQIICSFLSPPIFVDSRKAARDYLEKKMMSFVQLFHPGKLKKDFMKREKKLKKEVIIKIKNNIDGLYNYLTAPNIRHKIKHPIFFSIRFSTVFKILYNEKYFQKQRLSVGGILKKFQKLLVKNIGSGKKIKKDFEKAYMKPFVIQLTGQPSQDKRKKIFESLEYLISRTIDLHYNPNSGLDNYKDINTLGNVSKIYPQIFKSLDQISSQQIENRKLKESSNKNDISEDEDVSQDEKQEQEFCSPIIKKEEEELLSPDHPDNRKNIKCHKQDPQNYVDNYSEEKIYRSHLYRRYRPKYNRKRIENGIKMRINNFGEMVPVELRPYQTFPAEQMLYYYPVLPSIPPNQFLEPLFPLEEIISVDKKGFPINHTEYLPPQQAVKQIHQIAQLQNQKFEAQCILPLIIDPTLSLRQSPEPPIQMANSCKKQNGVEKQFNQLLKDEIIAKIDLQNSHLQKIIDQNLVTRAKIQQLFDYSKSSNQVEINNKNSPNGQPVKQEQLIQ